MKTKVDFSKYRFRASSLSKICAGKIGLTDKQKIEVLELENRKQSAKNGDLDSKNKPVKPLTANMELRLSELTSIKNDKLLPKTMITELRTIHRSETYMRYFGFSNKFTQKGIIQENEAITLYQNYLNRNGNVVLFTKNEKRLYNSHTTGLPDLDPQVINKIKRGFDVKSSWELETFPFEEDELITNYKWQNQDYIWLTDSDEWVTAYCLVNIHEHGLFNEKMKYWYPLGCPQSPEDENYEEYVEKCKELEVRLIFDYDRFMHHNPNHDIAMSRDEWMETINPFTGKKGYDIDMAERIIEKTTKRNEDDIDYIKERVELCRDVMQKLF